MLQQFEDALVQYDELDALFTQYVLNFGAGGKSTLVVCSQKDWFGFWSKFPVLVSRRGELAGLVLRPGA